MSFIPKALRKGQVSSLDYLCDRPFLPTFGTLVLVPANVSTAEIGKAEGMSKLQADCSRIVHGSKKGKI